MATAPKLVGAPTGQPRLEPGDILTPRELAKRLKVGVRWVYEQSSATRKGNPLPVLHCGRYLRFSWPEVCAWLRSK